MPTQALTCNKNPIEFLPSKSFLFSKTSLRRLEDVFSTLYVFQDILKTSSRRLQDVFAIHLPKTSSRRVYKTSCNYVFKTSSRRLGRQKNVALKTSSRRLQGDFSTSSPRRMFAGMKVSIIKSLFSKK